MLEFDVAGVPAPQGSKTAIVQGGKARLIDKNPKQLRIWREAVRLSGLEAVRRSGHFGYASGPVELWLMFRVERGKTVKRVWPCVRPDLDKYVRAVCDALTKATVYKDDGQVVNLHAQKRYVRDGEVPGVRIVVRPVIEKEKASE